MAVLGWVGWLLLVLLPGAWITFALKLPGIAFWLRLFIGMALSPLVVLVQFYLLRLAGIPFEPTVVLLVAVNLPAGYLIWRQRGEVQLPSREAVFSALLVGLILLASIAPFLIDAQKRLYTWEAWSQADVVYSLANGGLDLEDADLAGVRLSYPWAGHVYQAALSFLAGSPPVSNYIWSNLAWLVCIFALMAAIIAEMGGGRLAQIAGSVWLAFGVNFVGQVLKPLVPPAWVHAHAGLGQIWGDNRYSPWLDKVLFFGQILFALGLFAALAYLLIRRWPRSARSDYLVLTGLLLLGLGLVYPVLLPAAGALVGGRILAQWLWGEQPRQERWVEAAWLAVGVVTTAAIAWLYIHLLTEGRNSSNLIGLNSLQEIRWRIAESLVVASPLLLGLGLVFPRIWRAKRFALFILALAAAGSFTAYILFNVPWWRNEYKFVFTAAVCLAAFPSLAMETLLHLSGRRAVLALAIMTIILASPFFYNVYRNSSDGSPYYLPGPRVDVQAFDLRLADGEPVAALADIIRAQTPPDTLVIVETSNLHLPTLTRRTLYVAPPQTTPSPGILVTNDEMLVLVKGYPQTLVDERRATLEDLYTSQDPLYMQQALERILALNRPAAIVASRDRHAALLAWLAEHNLGAEVASEDGWVLWLVKPATGVTLTQPDTAAQQSYELPGKAR